MTLDQGFAFAIMVAMMAMFVWGRLRYDLVALLTLLSAVAVGIVPPERAFDGFGDDIVVIVAAALIVSAAVAHSGLVELALRKVSPYLVSTRVMVFVLVATVTALSAFVKNIGALAMLMPVAFQLARRTGTPPSYLLMPLSFGSLIGGLVTLIGTSPNIIVSRMREELLGEPFRMFDFAPVGIGIAVAGVVFLTFGYRLLPAARKGATSLDAALSLKEYTTEAEVPPESPMVGKTVADLTAIGEGDVEVAAIIRERFRRFTPSPSWTLAENDLLLLEGEPDALQRIVAQAKLRLIGGEEEQPEQVDANAEDVDVIEAVVTGDSPLIDQSPARFNLMERYQVRLLAVSRSDERITHRLRAVKFRAGDVVVLQGSRDTLPDTLRELHCLPLAERPIRLGRSRNRFLPIAVLAAAMALLVADVPVAVVFFGASLVLILLRSVSLKEAYDVIDWPILVLLGALIPVSEAMRTTGATDLIAGWLSYVGGGMPPIGALAFIMIVAMAATPFLNNAATVLVMAPIAAQLAAALGYRPDPFLMAVAIGAACDFLTPIGHQSNTLVMGAGGYRFGDYWRLGLPLSAIVVVVGVPLIALFWPLASP